MCGIAGIHGFGGNAEELAPRLEAMATAMRHRGPDEAGCHVETGMRAGLAVRRLSIVDLQAGPQPLFNEDRSIVVACNGEIYNHRELRAELERKGHRLRSRSDCEVIAHLYEEEGVDCLQRLNGMFAIALLDTRKQLLMLARDPVGMKHIHWCVTARGFVFGSEARALFASGLVSPAPDWNGLSSFFTFGFSPAPRTAFRDVHRLRAGSRLLVTREGVREERYWTPRFTREERVRSDADYAEEMQSLLERSVARHLDADVPAGLFLSGGWDSSLVALYAGRQSREPLDSYSLRFPDNPDLDESRYFRPVAKQAGTRSHEIEVRGTDLVAAAREAPLAVEEPLTTAPISLVYLLARTAGRSHKFVLGGEGADELFAGYDRFVDGPLHRLRKVVPGGLVPGRLPLPLSHRWRRALRFLSARTDETAQLELLTTPSDGTIAALFRPDVPLGRRSVAGAGPVTDATRGTFRDALDGRLAQDITGRLADGILLAEDKLSMAHSLEVRFPFLDREVLDFALRLPSSQKIRNGQRKAILAPLAAEFPDHVARRRKQGLGLSRSIMDHPAVRAHVTETVLETARSSGLFRRARLEKQFNGTEVPGLGALCYFCTWWNHFMEK